MKFSLLINMKMPTNVGIFIIYKLRKFHQFSMTFSLLINMKMTTTVMLTFSFFISWENFMLSWSSWQRGIAESGSSQLSTLMIETPGDLVWDQPCVQQASCLEGGPLLWIWPLYLHVNKKSDGNDDDDELNWARKELYLSVIWQKMFGL